MQLGGLLPFEEQLSSIVYPRCSSGVEFVHTWMVTPSLLEGACDT